MSFRSPVMTGVMLLGLPRLVVPMIILAAFGFLLNLCHPACPVDPLNHQMVCLQEEDPMGYERAVEAETGTKKTHPQWEAEANEQWQAKKEQEALDVQRLANDNAESARQVEVEDRQRCKNGEREYCRPSFKKHRRRHRAESTTILKEDTDEQDSGR